MTLQECIDLLEHRHYGLRRAARAVKVDVGYLSAMKHGKKKNPSNAILKKLGIRRVIEYDLARI